MTDVGIRASAFDRPEALALERPVRRTRAEAPASASLLPWDLAGAALVALGAGATGVVAPVARQRPAQHGDC